VEAMKDVDATLLLIGTGPLQADLESTSIGWAWGEDTLAGTRRRHIALLQRGGDAGAAVDNASRGVWLVQVEAMAAGIPVVNTMIESGVPKFRWTE